MTGYLILVGLCILAYIIIPRMYDKFMYFETPFDIPVTITTKMTHKEVPLNAQIAKKYHVIGEKQHITEETVQFIFTEGYTFENKIDGQIYPFPYYEKPFDYTPLFRKYGDGAIVNCRFMIKRHRLTGEIVLWRIAGAKIIKKGVKKDLFYEIEPADKIVHLYWRKKGYIDGMFPPYEINLFNDMLKDIDGLNYHIEIEDKYKYLFDEGKYNEYIRKTEFSDKVENFFRNLS